MENLSESLLQVWLQLSTSVINNRIVSALPYRESLVCNMLYMNALQTPDRLLTATDLCEMTNEPDFKFSGREKTDYPRTFLCR